MEENYMNNQAIEEAIDNYYKSNDDETLLTVLEEVANELCEGGMMLVAGDEYTISTADNGDSWLNVFTSYEEANRSPEVEVMEAPIEAILTDTWYAPELAGIHLNPSGKSFLMQRAFVRIVLEAAAESMGED